MTAKSGSGSSGIWACSQQTEEYEENGGLPTLVHVDERLDNGLSGDSRIQAPSVGNMCPSVGLALTIIAIQKLRILPDATLQDFALLTSAMHMAWMRAITGRTEERLYVFRRRGLQYLPDAAGRRRPLETGTPRPGRSGHPRGAPRSDAGRPLRSRPHAAQSAPGPSGSRPHRGRLYRRGGFASERERVEHLFALYEKMRAPLEARVKKKPRSLR